MASSKNQSNLKEKVYEVIKKIPRGKVATYGQIAEELKIVNGEWKIDARVVGWMLHLNDSADVPCHRVVDRNGRLAPNFAGPSKFRNAGRSGAFDGWREQKKRLEAERVKFKGEMYVDLDRCLWSSVEDEEVKVKMPV